MSFLEAPGLHRLKLSELKRILASIRIDRSSIKRVEGAPKCEGGYSMSALDKSLTWRVAGRDHYDSGKRPIRKCAKES
jgi:hypothetical protein